MNVHLWPLFVRVVSGFGVGFVMGSTLLLPIRQGKHLYDKLATRVFLRNTNLQKHQVNYDNSTTSNCHFERIHLLKHLWGEVVHCHFDSPERDFEPTCHWFGSPAQSAVALSRKRSWHRTGWGISDFGILGLQRSLPLCIMETHHPKLSGYHWLMQVCCDWHGKYMKIHGFKMPSSLTLFDSSFRSRDTGQNNRKCCN